MEGTRAAHSHQARNRREASQENKCAGRASPIPPLSSMEPQCCPPGSQISGIGVAHAGSPETRSAGSCFDTFRLVAADLAADCPDGEMAPVPGADPALGPTTYTARMLLDKSYPANEASPPAHAGSPETRSAGSGFDTFRLVAADRAADCPDGEMAPVPGADPALGPTTYTARMLLDKSYPANEAPPPAHAGSPETRSAGSCFDTFRLVAADRAADCPDGEMAPVPGADPALGPTTYTARMLLDKSYPANEASPPAHAGSPETRSAGSCFDTFRLVAADRAADCPDGEMAPVPGADPALGPTTYTARMLLDKSYPANEASPPAHAGSPETRSAGSCFDTFRLVAADRAADCPDGEMAPVPGADPALGPTTYTARMLLDKSYPANEASPPAHAGSPETRSAGSCFDTFRLVAADRAADCPDGEMAPVPGADPALGPTTYTARMLLDKSYPANEAPPPAHAGSPETRSAGSCFDTFRLVAADRAADCPDGEMAPGPGADPALGPTTYTARMLLDKSYPASEASPPAHAGSPETRSAGSCFDTFRLVAADRAADCPDGEMAPVPGADPALGPTTYTARMLLDKSYPANEASPPAHAGSPETRSAGSCFDTFRLVAADRAADCPDGEMAPVPGADPALGPTTYTARMLLDKSYPASEASPPAHAGSPETRSAGSCFDTFRLVAADRAADCPDGEMAPVPGADPALGPTTYTARMLLDKSYPANEAYPPAPDGSLETCSTSCCSEAGDSCVAAAFGTGAVSKSLPAVRVSGGPAWAGGEAIIYIEWLPEALLQVIICRLGVAAFELACTSRLYLVEVRMAQDEGRLSKSKISRALIDAGFPAVMANCSEGTAARRHMVEAGRPGPGPSALFWTGWIRGSRTSTHHRRAIDMFEVIAILYWLWKQRRRVRLMLMRWLSRTGKAAGQANATARLHYMTRLPEGMDRGLTYSRAKEDLRSAAAELLAMARYRAGQLYVKWSIPHPWLRAAVAKQLQGVVPKEAGSPRARHYVGASSGAGDSTPSYEALRCAARNAGSVPSACSTSPAEQVATIDMANAFWQLPLAEGQSKDWQLPRVEGRSKDIITITTRGQTRAGGGVSQDGRNAANTRRAV